MTRLPDWQDRLTRFLAGRARSPFQPGRHDCATFAAGAVEAMTGVDLAAGWRGTYGDLGEGLAALEAAGIGDHLALVSSLLPEIAAAEARPGDIAALRIGQANLETLAVVQGAMAYVPVEGAAGFILLPMRLATRAWRVG